MTALDELHHQCERRGWRLALAGTAHHPDGSPGPQQVPGLIVDRLEVRGVRHAGRRELLTCVPVDGLADLALDTAAVEAARSLAQQGLITTAGGGS